MTVDDLYDVILDVRERMVFNLECFRNAPLTGRSLLLERCFEFELHRCDAMVRLLNFELQGLDRDMSLILDEPEIPEELFQEYLDTLDPEERLTHDDYVRVLTTILTMIPFYRTGLSMTSLLSRGESPLSDTKIASLIHWRDMFEEISAMDPDIDLVQYVEFCSEEISLVIRACTGKDIPEDEAVFHMQWSLGIDHNASHDACMDFAPSFAHDLEQYHNGRMLRWSVITGRIASDQIYGVPSTRFEYEW